MGQGFYIIIFDGYGISSNMINPRILENEKGKNFFSYHNQKEKKEKIRKLIENYNFYRIVD